MRLAGVGESERGGRSLGQVLQSLSLSWVLEFYVRNACLEQRHVLSSYSLMPIVYSARLYQGVFKGSGFSILGITTSSVLGRHT